MKKEYAIKLSSRSHSKTKVNIGIVIYKSIKLQKYLIFLKMALK